MTERREGPNAEGTALDGAGIHGRLADLERRLRATEQELRECSGTLRMAVEVGRLGLWERDLETGAMRADETAMAILGLGPDEPLTFERLQSILHQDDIDRIDHAVAYALRTKTDFNVEHRIVRPDGTTGRVLLRGSPLFVGDRAARLVGVMQDVSERQRAREEVSLAQRRQEFLLGLNDQLRSLDDPGAIMEAAARSLGHFFEVDYVGYAEVDEESGRHVVTREWSKAPISHEGRGYSLEEFFPNIIEELKTGRPIYSSDVTTDPRLADPTRQALYRTINTRAVVGVPFVRNDRLMAILYVYSAKPRTWSSDDLSLIEDVTERTWIAVERARAVADLTESEARFRGIAEAIPALVWVIDQDLHLTYANDRWLDLSGLPVEQALGDSWRRWIHPDDLARVLKEVEPARAGHTSFESEMRYRAQNGEYRWHLIRMAPFYSAWGEFKGWCGTSVDIHDFKEAQAALLQSEKQLKMALKAAKMGHWTWDTATDTITLSDETAAIDPLGVRSSSTWSEILNSIHPGDAPRVEALVERAIREGIDYNVEYRFKRPGENSWIWLAVYAQALIDEETGRIVGISGVTQEVTDRKNAEQRQHLLIRELHHRVKNTLATVQAIVGSTARTASSIDEFYQGFVGRIVSLARTHNLLTEDLWQKASLEELIRTELGPYEDEARNRITVQGPPVELPSEAAVPISMAIHELTTNAAKHGALSTFGGQVEVGWEVRPGEDRPILSFSWIEQGGPKVTPPTRQGFGSRLLQRVLTTQLQAEVNMDFLENGVHFRMVMPIPGEPPIFDPER